MRREETIVSTMVLVAYATRYGSTHEVAEALAATMRERGLAVDLRPMASVDSLAGYRAIVMGAPIFMFRWHKDALRFLARHRQALTERPVAVFALGPVHDPNDPQYEEKWRDSRAQLDKELARFPWLTPIAATVFGGKCDPKKLRFPLSLFAGWVPANDLRDWAAIREWAVDLASNL